MNKPLKAKLIPVIDNIKVAYSRRYIWIISIIYAIGLQIVQYFFTDYATLEGNMGSAVLTFEIISQILFSTLFGFNAGLFSFKFAITRTINVKESTLSTIGSFFSLLITGCPACSITFASYLGLASILATLPFFGYEVKVLGLIILVYSTYYLAKNLTACKRKVIKKAKKKTR